MDHNSFFDDGSGGRVMRQFFEVVVVGIALPVGAVLAAIVVLSMYGPIDWSALMGWSAG